MRLFLFLGITLLTLSCTELGKGTQSPNVHAKKEKKEVSQVKIKVTPSTSTKEQARDSNSLKKQNWIKLDRLLVTNFFESTLGKGNLEMNYYLDFFGEQSEFEIGALVIKFGETAVEQSKLIYANPNNRNSLILSKLEK